MKKKLCVFTLYNEKGASSNYRMYIYEEEFKQKFETTFLPFWSNNYSTKYIVNKRKYKINIMFSFIFSCIKRLIQILFIGARSDYVVFQKGVFPHLNINLISYLKIMKTKTIFDVDDAIYLYDKNSSNRIATKVDKVIVGNQNLKKHYSKFNKVTTIIPTIDNTINYKKFWKETFDVKSIGWIGSKATIDNLDLVVNAINRIVLKYPDVTFSIICDDDYGYLEKINNSKLITWKASTYQEELSKITIGIMPLKDSEMNRGKCGFKLIQYLNSKKPVLASDIGVNREVVSNYGEICKTEDEWFENIEKLLTNENIYSFHYKNIENSFFELYNHKRIATKIIDFISR